MKKLQKTIILVFLFQIGFGQNPNIINNEAIQFSLKQKKDTIDFILVDTKTDKKKSIFLFCQGSLPIPLFIQPEKEEMWMFGGGITNFDINEIKKHYHLIVISMPKTPVIVNEKNLNSSYCYIPNSNKPDEFDSEYVTSDYLENYEKRANEVLKFLKKQKWVDNSKLIVAGHSQGSRVATAVTLKNKNVTHLGLFGANPFGRIDQRIREYRNSVEKKEMTWDEADERTESTYQMLRDSYDANELNKYPYLLAWKSFSKPFINDWLQIKIPTYLAYGTNDSGAELCDLVPLFYTQNSKTNLTYKRYPNLEHNFFEVDENGKANYDKEHWKEVMNEFVKWTIK
jgi:pimeloyl-ACP methyl ester carboxylesterase